MELSIFVAKIAAILYLSAGVAVLNSQITIDKIMSSFENSQGLTMVSGLFGIIIGMLLIEYHNFWVNDWTVLITIIGWAALFKGILYIAFPKTLFSFKPLFKNMQAWGKFMIALGLFFGYFGFLA